MRIFLICTLGMKNNGMTLQVDNFDLKTDKFPTREKCLHHAKKLHPELKEISLLSITELSESDFKEFISDQHQNH